MMNSLVLKEIFGECGMEKRIKINKVLKDMYDGKFETVKKALDYYGVHITIFKYEMLVRLVGRVEKGDKREYFEVDESNGVRYWYVTDLDGETLYCVRIRDEDEWKRAVDLMVKKFGVDRDYGIIKSGIREFIGPHIYLFGKYEIESENDDPESNWYGSTSTNTFLLVDTYEERKEVYEGFLKNVINGEKGSVLGIVD